MTLENEHGFITPEEILQASLDAIENGISVLDADLNVLWANRTMEKWYNHAVPLTGKKCYEAFHNRDTPCASCPSQDALQNGEPAVERVHFVQSAGRPGWFELYAYPLKNRHGQIYGVVEFLRDINASKKIEDTLRYQYQFESMIADISSTFVNTPSEKIDQAIDYALKLSGEFFDADRCYICRFSEDGLFMDNTHEWCAEGISSMQERNQGFPLEITPWWAEQLRSGVHVYVPDVEDLPPEADQDKIDFMIEGTRSFLTIPLIKGEQVIGIYGFKVVSEKKELSEQQIALLRVVADIIAGATIKHEAEEALKQSEENYREILATMEEGYYESDLEGTITYCNDAACRLLGYESGEMIGVSYRQLFKDPEQAGKTFYEVFCTGQPERGLILEMFCKDGAIVYGELSISLVKNKEGCITGFKGIGRDVTESKQYEQGLEYLSLYDQLTGIYNRSFFEAELNRLNNGREYPVTIIYADLDGLKLVNDTMGHDAGDKILQDCACVLKNSLRQSDLLARVGGDEFSAILARTNHETGKQIIRRIKENIEQYNRDKEWLPLGISLGIATAEKQEDSLRDLFKHADDMMYRDKLYSGSSSRGKIIQSLLTALAEIDYISGGHVRRLEDLCRAIGEKIGLSLQQIDKLTLLAQVHDLGKVGIPHHILFKPSPLNEEEWEIMCRHPGKGYRIASSSPELPAVADLILKHHECWDGSGYPLGLSSTLIPVECRILAIVDAFDVMTNKRSYNNVKTVEEAVQELEDNAGSQFDPHLVPVFLSVLEERNVSESPGYQKDSYPDTY